MHFWYSASHARELPEIAALMSPSRSAQRNFAIIDGKEREYTLASRTRETIYKRPDMVYLGEGTYSRSESY